MLARRDLDKNSHLNPKSRTSMFIIENIVFPDRFMRFYSYMKHSEHLSKYIIFENEPTNAPWGERFIHIREPDGYQLSFAQSLS